MLNNDSQGEPGATDDEERGATTRHKPEAAPAPGDRDDAGRRMPRLAALRKVGRSRRPW